jgi:hypothetical protein
MEYGVFACPIHPPRAVALGIPVTIQQPLLHDTAEVEVGYWVPNESPSSFPPVNGSTKAT